MAQTTTLTAGTSGATSTDIAAAPGASVIVGIFFCRSGRDPADRCPVRDSSGHARVDNVIGILKYDQKSA